MITGCSYGLTSRASYLGTNAAGKKGVGTSGGSIDDGTVSQTVSELRSYANDMNQTTAYRVYARGILNSLPIYISSLTDLEKIGNDSFYPLDGKYILTADINCGTSNWKPIGSPYRFQGVFDGGGHTITYYMIDVVIHRSQGLFGYVGEEGVVRNLNVEGTVTGAIQSNYGGVAGENDGRISNCYSSVNVNSTYGGEQLAGGIAGRNLGFVTYCSASGDVGEGIDVGGIVGMNADGRIYNCTFTGHITSTATNRIGMIIGEDKNDAWTNLKNCYYYVNANGIKGIGTLVSSTDQYGSSAPRGYDELKAFAGSEDLANYQVYTQGILRGLPTPIASADELRKIGTDAAYPLNGSYILTENIDCGTSNWTPIGT